jgi:hypothetical protein
MAALLEPAAPLHSALHAGLPRLLAGLGDCARAHPLHRFVALALAPALAAALVAGAPGGAVDDALLALPADAIEGGEAALLRAVLRAHCGAHALRQAALPQDTAAGGYAAALEDGFLALAAAARPFDAAPRAAVRGRLEQLARAASVRLAPAVAGTAASNDDDADAAAPPTREAVCRALATGALPPRAALVAVSGALFTARADGGAGLHGNVDDLGALANVALDALLLQAPHAALPVTLCAAFAAVAARAGVPGVRLVVPPPAAPKLPVVTVYDPAAAAEDAAAWSECVQSPLEQQGQGLGRGPEARLWLECFTPAEGVLPPVAAASDTGELMGLGPPEGLPPAPLAAALRRAAGNATRALCARLAAWDGSGNGSGDRPPLYGAPHAVHATAAAAVALAPLTTGDGTGNDDDGSGGAVPDPLRRPWRTVQRSSRAVAALVSPHCLLPLWAEVTQSEAAAAGGDDSGSGSAEGQRQQQQQRTPSPAQVARARSRLAVVVAVAAHLASAAGTPPAALPPHARAALAAVWVLAKWAHAPGGRAGANAAAERRLLDAVLLHGGSGGELVGDGDVEVAALAADLCAEALAAVVHADAPPAHWCWR